MLKLDEEQKSFLEALGNASRLKILIALWRSKEELKVYKICKYTGLGRSAVQRHLKVLVEAGLISRRIYGEIPLYAINTENLRAKALVEFFNSIKL